MDKKKYFIILVILITITSLFAQEKNDIIPDGGVLTFRLVDEDATEAFNAYYTANPTTTFNENGTLIDSSIVPANREIFKQYVKDEQGTEELLGYLVLNKETVLDNTHIASVESSLNYWGRTEVSFLLDAEGTDLFADFTGSNIGKSLAIVLDDKIILHAVIMESIPEGSITVSGFNVEEAQDILRAFGK